MEKRFLILFFLSFNLVKSQTNLVVNGGFEVYLSCPDNNSEINYAQGWYGSMATPDYFNACCSPSVGFSVPKNNLGYQIPFEGQAYSGFQAYYNLSDSRECLSSQLINLLQIGVKYFVSLRVVLADDPYGSAWGIDKLGVLFSTQQYIPSTPPPINNFSQVHINTIITDSTSWTIIKGSFIADSTYKFINVSNFFHVAQIDTSTRNPNATTSGSLLSYYLVDDIRVSTDSLFGLGYVGIKEITDIESKIKLYPNPSSNELFVETGELTDCQLIMYNVMGQLILDQALESKMKLDVHTLSNGAYFYKISSTGKLLKSGKLIISR